MKRLSTYALVALLLTSGCRKDVSGTYLASDSTAVLWLQLVRTPDDHLTGQLSVSRLDVDGKISFDTVALSGAFGDDNVTLSGSRFFGLQSFTLSGRLEGDTLTLSGSGSPTPFVLKRTEMPEYQRDLAKLNTAAQSVLAAKAAAVTRQRAEQWRRGILAQIDDTISRMQRFNSAADTHLARFPGVENGYEAITAKVGDYVQREQKLVGMQSRSVLRSQLAIGARQASFATDQLHDQGESVESEMEGIKSLVADATNLESVCHDQQVSVFTEQRDWKNAACNRLASANGPFRSRYAAMISGLAHLEQVYKREKSKQEELLKTADQLQ